MTDNSRRRLGMWLICVSSLTFVVACALSSRSMVIGSGSSGNFAWTFVGTSIGISWKYLLPIFLCGALSVYCLARSSRRPPKFPHCGSRYPCSANSLRAARLFRARYTDRISRRQTSCSMAGRCGQRGAVRGDPRLHYSCTWHYRQCGICVLHLCCSTATRRFGIVGDATVFMVTRCAVGVVVWCGSWYHVETYMNGSLNHLYQREQRNLVSAIVIAPP